MCLHYWLLLGMQATTHAEQKCFTVQKIPHLTLPLIKHNKSVLQITIYFISHLGTLHKLTFLCFSHKNTKDLPRLPQTVSVPLCPAFFDKKNIFTYSEINTYSSRRKNEIGMEPPGPRRQNPIRTFKPYLSHTKHLSQTE